MPVRCSIECTLHCVVRLSRPVPRAITRWAAAALRPPTAAQRKAPRSIAKNPPETRLGFASAPRISFDAQAAFCGAVPPALTTLLALYETGDGVFSPR